MLSEFAHIRELCGALAGREELRTSASVEAPFGNTCLAVAGEMGLLPTVGAAARAAGDARVADSAVRVRDSC